MVLEVWGGGATFRSFYSRFPVLAEFSLCVFAVKRRKSIRFKVLGL